MICAVCDSPLEDPPDLEEVYHSIYCDCGNFAVHFWDRKVLTRIVEIIINLRTFKLIFSEEKTDIHEIFYTDQRATSHGVHANLDWSEHITTLPFMLDIPKDLENKLKIWITFC